MSVTDTTWTRRPMIIIINPRVKFSMKMWGHAFWARLEQRRWQVFLMLPICFSFLTFLFVCNRALLDSAMVVLDERFAPIFSDKTSAIPVFVSGAPPPLFRGCNIFDGNWVYDETYPLYDFCPLAEQDFQCHFNGRTDKSYQKWRWQPHECSIPKLNAEDMLSRLRGLRVVIVGDSMGRTQWESLNCLLLQGVRKKSSVEMVNGPITKYKSHIGMKFADHDVTIDYFRSPFLVHKGKRVPKRSPSRVRTTINLKKVDVAVAENVVDADVLLVNTGHWWTPQKTYDKGCYFQMEEKLMLGMTVLDAYAKAVNTITAWVNAHVDFNRTEVFFRSYEPPHWEQKMASMPYRTMAKFEDYPQARILSSAVERMRRPGLVLNVTSLSSNRPDGHVFNWTSQSDVLDCAHWCLPGVPDTWNELLYASLLLRGRGAWSVANTTNSKS